MTTDFHQSPDDVLANLLNLRLSPAVANEPLVAYMLGRRIPREVHRCRQVPGDSRLGATKHASDFNEFIVPCPLAPAAAVTSDWSREEIVEQCHHNQARQIPDTHYWAIMNIDTPTKRRFLSRVLEFIGYREEIIDLVCGAIGVRRPIPRSGRSGGFRRVDPIVLPYFRLPPARRDA